MAICSPASLTGYNHRNQDGASTTASQSRESTRAAYSWACTVQPIITVALPGRSIAAYPIECSATSAKGAPRERVVHYFSPELGTPVGRVRYSYEQGETTERWLIATLSAAEASEEIVDAVRRAGLDLRKSSESRLGASGI